MSYGGEYLTKDEARAYARLLLGLRGVEEAFVELNEQSRRYYSVRAHWTQRPTGERRTRYLDSPDAVAWAIAEILEGQV